MQPSHSGLLRTCIFPRTSPRANGSRPSSLRTTNPRVAAEFCCLQQLHELRFAGTLLRLQKGLKFGEVATEGNRRYHGAINLRWLGFRRAERVRTERYRSRAAVRTRSIKG